MVATGHDESDVRLAEALGDRASFRRFCGFSTHEATPERTSFVRFRSELVRLGLDRSLFAAVKRQLDAREPAAPGNGHMIALLAPCRVAVDEFYSVTLANGAVCEGLPRVRPQYHPEFYGALLMYATTDSLVQSASTRSPAR